MPNVRKARDLSLIDAIDRFDRESFEGVVWRVVREGRDPLQGHPSAGRWDPGAYDLDALYTATEADGALAEVSFHLSRQPVFPSRMRLVLHKIAVRSDRALRLASANDLTGLGVDPATYQDVLYSRTQEIGDVADFLGFDGIISPNARWKCLNLTLFTRRIRPENLSVLASTSVDIREWARRTRT